MAAAACTLPQASPAAHAWCSTRKQFLNDVLKSGPGTLQGDKAMLPKAAEMHSALPLDISPVLSDTKVLLASTGHQSTAQRLLSHQPPVGGSTLAKRMSIFSRGTATRLKLRKPLSTPL